MFSRHGTVIRRLQSTTTLAPSFKFVKLYTHTYTYDDLIVNSHSIAFYVIASESRLARAVNASCIVASYCTHFGPPSLNASPTRAYEMSPIRATGLSFVMSMPPRSVSMSLRTWIYLTCASMSVLVCSPVKGWVISMVLYSCLEGA